MNLKSRFNNEVQEGNVEKERNNRYFQNEKKATSTSTSTSTLPRNNRENKIRESNSDNLQFRSMENSTIENDLRDFYGSGTIYQGNRKSSNIINNSTNMTTSNDLFNQLNSNNNKDRGRNNPVSKMTEDAAESQLLELDHEIGTHTSFS